MPIYLRNFIFNELKEHYDEQNKKSQNHQIPPNSKRSNPPNQNPKPLPVKSSNVPTFKKDVKPYIPSRYE